MIYYHSIPEGHQCPGSFQEIGNIFQKNKNVALIYFEPMLRKSKKNLKLSFRELMVLKGLKTIFS
jgi:hypothetical protein